ncbi:hypothetical protein HDV03_004774 [Kappamyces sp. JEL0829]|nr:hypothetical protein HDV03_004774 [Kappamyces sp. JEL0829]
MDAWSHTYAKALLTLYARDLQREGLQVKAFVIEGDVKTSLEHEINSLQPNMVVVSSRGLMGIANTLLGSVSHHLVHHCKVPVMIIPID